MKGNPMYTFSKFAALMCSVALLVTPAVADAAKGAKRSHARTCAKGQVKRGKTCARKHRAKSKPVRVINKHPRIKPHKRRPGKAPRTGASPTDPSSATDPGIDDPTATDVAGPSSPATADPTGAVDPTTADSASTPTPADSAASAAITGDDVPAPDDPNAA